MKNTTVTTSDHWLRRARQQRGWTQAQAAARLGVSQTYWSLLESDRRAVSTPMAARLARHFDVPPTRLPVRARHTTGTPDALARALSASGYPGFTHVRRGQVMNPAQLLVSVLGKPELEPRVVEGLPWLVLRHADLDWAWVVRQAKLHDLQNRLGFVVALARQLAEQKDEAGTAAVLSGVEGQLEHARLAREDTLCHASMTQAERRWLRQHRSPLAQHWNLLTSLVPEHLSYAS